MSWKNPEAFWLFVPLVMLAFWLLWPRGSLYASVKFSSSNFFRGIRPSWKVRIRHLPLVLQLIAASFMIVALARPQQSDTKVKRNVEGVDIVITMDISDSMLIEDMEPKNRLEAARKVIKEFVNQRTSDRLGLVVFSGESYTRVPPTLDYKLLLKSVEEVQTTRSLKMGTAIGVALANAVARLKDSTAKSRVIIFLTDGESNSGTIAPETALEIAKGFGIKIYSIGMGVDGDAQLPVTTMDAFGNAVKRYQPIHSSVNDSLLGRMAEETGGKYYRATTGQALQKVFQEINKLEKTKIEVNQYTRYTELFPQYLMVALYSFVMAFVLQKLVLRRVP
jgi:Ca-activated chloride channel family protein